MHSSFYGPVSATTGRREVNARCLETRSRRDLPFPRTGCNLTCTLEYTRSGLCPDHGQPFRNPVREGLPTIRQLIDGLSRTIVRSERGFVIFPLLFLISNELREACIVSVVGQVGVPRKYRIAGKTLGSGHLEPPNGQCVSVHESIGRRDVVFRMMKMDEIFSLLRLPDLPLRKPFLASGGV